MVCYGYYPEMLSASNFGSLWISQVKQFSMGGRSVYACSKRQCLDVRRPKQAAGATKLRRSGTEHLEEMVPAVKV